MAKVEETSVDLAITAPNPPTIKVGAPPPFADVLEQQRVFLEAQKDRPLVLTDTYEDA